MATSSLGVRILKWFGILLVLVVIAGLVMAWQVGAWNLIFPKTDHDTVAPRLPTDLESPAVLVFTKTNSFRHVDGIEGGSAVLEELVAKRGWGHFHTENGAVFNAQDLSRFDAVVFLNASGDMLNEDQEAVFETWMEAGGGWLGVHAAGDGSHLTWQWYRDNLIGADFTAHIMGPQFQVASVLLENQRHPVLTGIPDIWQHEEEWYSWASSPRMEGFTVLATLDEDSYSPTQRMWWSEVDLSMGDHPVVWSNCIGAGRSVYAAMGHLGEAFRQPQVKRILANALDWLVTDGGTCEAAALAE
ncbi:MAG: ThuA domain-containing protein [Halioglobus sp.]|nr:ThuA domain-containing protein [Halioglobus sp.]